MAYTPNFPLVKAQFARRLKELRESQGLRRGKHYSQKEIAEQLGISRRAYVDWENPAKEDSYPREINVWISLCEILGTDLIFLATGMFDGKRERKHQDKYVNIYSRYCRDADFHYLLNMLMRWDAKIIRAITDHYEAFLDHYEGEPPIV